MSAANHKFKLDSRQQKRIVGSGTTLFPSSELCTKKPFCRPCRAGWLTMLKPTAHAVG